MADRELLELAAKAAGYPISEGCYEKVGNDAWWVYLDGNGEPPNDSTWTEVWNPLTDDGDALRLAVTLNMAIQPCTLVDPPFLPSVECGQYRGDDPNQPEWAEEALGSDPCAATRRAIVRAAAEIGKGMK